MSQSYAVFIMMSNYFHDVATAMLMAASAALWLILKFYEKDAAGDSLVFLAKLHRGFSKLIIFSWVWIISAGLFRILTFRIYEWPNAVEKHQEYGLLVKYCIASAMMAGGAWLWSLVGRRMQALGAVQRGV